jgi:aminopeptidase N
MWRKACYALGVLAGTSTPLCGASFASPGWHVTWYHLQLRIEPATKAVQGSVTIRAVSPSTITASVTLQLDSALAVDSVIANGTRAGVTRSGGDMIVSVPQHLRAGAVATFMVHYHGVVSGALTFDTRDGEPTVGSYGMPYSAAGWWPSRDTPADKADSADIEFTLPAALLVVSNGRLVSRRANSDGTATTHWAVRYPIYPDVISIAAARYATFTLSYHSASRTSMSMPFFVFPEDSARAFEDFSVLPSIMAHHAARFGEYPFIREKYGVAEFTVPSFREHQTLPSYGPGMITGDHKNDVWLAHELAHQWFGNSLSVRSWADLWLNEGFATYAALLWIEQSKGEPAYQAAIAARMRIPFPRPVYRPDSTNVSTLFDAAVFQKGALVLHMLRHVMGDEHFFDALRAYVRKFAYRNVTTDDFRAECERAYGKPLGWFFREWIYRSGQPRYAVDWAMEPGSGGRGVTITVTQKQDSTVFTMPLDLQVSTRSGNTMTVVRDSLREQRFHVTATDSVTAVAIDPDHWILRTP